MAMADFTRRSVLRGSLVLAAAGTLARPHIANAAATTAEVWWNQGFVPEEDAAFRAMVADYEKASGNKIEQSLIPFAPLRQKAVAAREGGLQNFRYPEYLGRLPRFFQTGARQTACARDAQHLRLRLSVNRERRRPDRHLQRLDDRAWWQGPGNARRQAPYRRPAGARGGGQGAPQADDPL